MHCDEIVMKPYSPCEYNHMFSFPKEWDTEECFWLTGIWVSHEEDVLWICLVEHTHFEL